MPPGLDIVQDITIVTILVSTPININLDIPV
jgi:hypothetical protein